MPLIETEEAARRLARAIASDLSLYNEEKILQGIQNDNLFTSLAEEVEEGRALYKSRVPCLAVPAMQFAVANLGFRAKYDDLVGNTPEVECGSRA